MGDKTGEDIMWQGSNEIFDVDLYKRDAWSE